MVSFVLQWQDLFFSAHIISVSLDARIQSVQELKKNQNKTALTFDYGNGSSQILGYIQRASRMCAPVM